MGAAGCAAALTAHDAGATVVVLEKTAATEAGGNTRVSGGGWFHHDNPERVAVYLRALCGDGALPESVVLAWAHGSQEVSAWVESLGVAVAPTATTTPQARSIRNCRAANATADCTASTGYSGTVDCQFDVQLGERRRLPHRRCDRVRPDRRSPRGSTHRLNVGDRRGGSRTSAGTSRDLLHNGGRMWHYS